MKTLSFTENWTIFNCRQHSLISLIILAVTCELLSIVSAIFIELHTNNECEILLLSQPIISEILVELLLHFNETIHVAPVCRRENVSFNLAKTSFSQTSGKTKCARLPSCYQPKWQFSVQVLTFIMLVHKRTIRIEVAKTL